MGDRIWDWFLPIRPTPGDGVTFEYNERLVKKLRARAKRVLGSQSSVSGTVIGSRRFPGGVINDNEVGGSGQHI